jgi:4-hydroxybenzoyl-CoA thioesterase
MAFRTLLKVRFGDIDHAGIVYYPRFLHYFHVALEEFFGSQVGVDYATVINEHRVGLPTVHLETDFYRPLRYGEQIEIEVSVTKLGGTSITWKYNVYVEGEAEPAIEGSNVTVCLDMETFKKREIPNWLRQNLEKLLPV